MPKPEDFQFRQMIGENLDTSMMVEAGAGSGKTASLVERMLALIGAGQGTVDQMAAVTFTRKAAAELKGRFQLKLESALKEETEVQRRTRFQEALQKLEFLFAGTIHSFCARLLRERPVEAGLDPDFTELEEQENALLRDRCWLEYLEGLHAEGAPILQDIMDLGLDPAKLTDTFRNVALYPEVEPVVRKEEKPDFQKERDLFKKYLNQALKALPVAVPEKGWDLLQDTIRRIQRKVRNLDLKNDSDFIKILSAMDKDPAITLYKWPDKDLAKAQAEAFQKFREEVVIPSLNRWRSYCHPFIMAVVVPAVAFFKRVRERHSQMNYHDLLLSAAELLRNHPEVREYFQERFTQLLVDEFQDTDPIQAEVILLLAGRDSRETSWHKVAVKPGALFIVGDPKQSIYRFRRADIGVYNEVKEIITRSGGQVIPLTTNFRSLPTLCRWVNPIFKEKFPDRPNKFQPAFEELVPFKTSPGGGVRKITLGDVKGNVQATIARMDAQRIAAYIRWAVSGNLELLYTADGKETPSKRKAVPGDFLILLRYKQHLPFYAGELEAQGLPYEISGGGDFNQSEELSQLMNLLAALAEPDDPVALTATLRGMFYGVSDDLLYRFKKSGGFFSYLVSPARCTDPQAGDRMEAVFSDLREMHQWTRSGPPAAALGRILSRLGLIPLARTREMGESRSGNLLKALEIALMESGKGVTSFPEMVEKIREYIDEVEVEGMPIEPGKEDVVRIMNLHKAKGLEAPVVFLADPIREVSHEPDLHITRKGKKAKGYFTAFQQLAEYKSEMIGLPPDWEQYRDLEQEYQEAEEERLLYVAVTRAMQLLIVSQYPKKSDKGAWKDLNPYLVSIQELEYSTVPAPVPITEKITTQRFQAGKQSIADGLARSKEPSYQVETVTKKSKASGEEAPFTQDTGRGFSWGRILHKLLEVVALDENADLDLMAENLLKEEERPLLEKPLVVETVKGIISSDLWKRMRKATAAYVEVPFSLKVIETGLPQIVSGAIDLVFQEPDGWVIADYKTDAVDGNLDKLVTYYRPQVELYKKFWEEMTGEGVKEAGLYFLDLHKWIVI